MAPPAGWVGPSGDARRMSSPPLLFKIRLKKRTGRSFDNKAAIEVMMIFSRHNVAAEVDGKMSVENITVLVHRGWRRPGFLAGPSGGALPLAVPPVPHPAAPAQPQGSIHNTSRAPLPRPLDNQSRTVASPPCPTQLRAALAMLAGPPQPAGHPAPLGPPPIAPTGCRSRAVAVGALPGFSPHFSVPAATPCAASAWMRCAGGAPTPPHRPAGSAWQGGCAVWWGGGQWRGVARGDGGRCLASLPHGAVGRPGLLWAGPCEVSCGRTLSPSPIRGLSDIL